MPILAVVIVALSLAIYFVPVLILRNTKRSTAHDYFVSSGKTPPRVFQNSAIAYSLQMATFGPFFLWGASSDIRPALTNSLCFGIGLWVVFLFRRKLFAFLDTALRNRASITVHQFIALQHGNSMAVRATASCLTIFALLGLVLGEMLGVATLLKPTLLQNADATYVFVACMLFLMFCYTVLSGNSGVMRSDQAQLAVAYVGLFGAATLLFLTSQAALDGRALLASLFMAALPVAMLIYRKGRFIDVGADFAVDSIFENVSFGRVDAVRLFRRFEVALNALVITAAIAVICSAGWYAFHSGIMIAIAESSNVLLGPTSFSGWGYLALVLLPLFYQTVDITNWQRIATQVRDQVASGNADPEDRIFRRVFLIFSVESPLIWMFMCLFGGLAVAVSGVGSSNSAFSDFVTRLVTASSWIDGWTAVLLLAAVFAIALSTTSAIFSATLLAVREDLLPAFDQAPDNGDSPNEAALVRKTIRVGIGLYFLILAGFYIADRVLKIGFGSEQFLAILFAFYCGQLAFVPLIIGPLWKRRDGTYGTLTPGWAMLVLAAGAGAGIVSQGIYLASGEEAWLWGAIPLCLILSWVAFLGGRLFSAPVSSK